MTAWLGLIGALLGAAIGGFATYKVAMNQFDYERRTDALRRRVAAMEEIYLLLAKSVVMAKELFRILKEARYEASARDAERNPLLGDVWDERVFEHVRLHMLISFYAPSLNADAEVIQSMLTSMITSVRRASTADPLLRGEESDTERISKTEHVFEALVHATDGAQEKLTREMGALNDGG